MANNNGNRSLPPMPPGRKLGGSSEAALLARGAHPYKRLWSNVVKRIKTPRVQEAAEKARREYANWAKEKIRQRNNAAKAAAKARENAAKAAAKARNEEKIMREAMMAEKKLRLSIATEAARMAEKKSRNRTRLAGKGKANYNYETVRAANILRQEQRVKNAQAKAAVKAAVKAAMAPRKPNNKETRQIANAVNETLNNLINTVKSNTARERWQNAKRRVINARRRNNKAVNEALRNILNNVSSN